MKDLNGFSHKAQKLITILSQQEARRLYCDIINPEHLFLAILRDIDSPYVSALVSCGIDIEDIHREIEMFLSSKSNSTLLLGPIPYSQRFERIIDNAKEISKIHNDSYIGPEHLILALINENDPDAIIPVMLNNRGISNEMIENALFDKLNSAYKNLNQNNMKKTQKNKATPFLDKFTVNLNNLARENKLDPVIGRTTEIKRVMQILSRRQKNNPILIGDPGVGKTAIVEGIAQLIVSNSVSNRIADKKILLLDLGSVVAGTKYRGEFEERMKSIIKEAEENQDVILFIDEIHTILGAGNSEGGLDASNLLKPALSRGTIRCIGATTLDEYRKKIEKDKALVRRFQTVFIKELTKDETIELLSDIKKKYEDFHCVKYTDEAIKAAVDLSIRYLPDKFLPDKAIDIIDEAGSKFGDKLFKKPDYIIKLEKEIYDLENQKIESVKNQDYETSAILRDKINHLKNILENQKEALITKNKKDPSIITKEEIEMIVSEMTNIPVNQISDKDNLKKYTNIEEELKKSIIGQDEAISSISKLVKKSIAGIRNYNKPILSMLFLGPTGVGKTALAKALANFIFGSEREMIRIDMSEYSEKFNSSRIVGAPPGYIGYDKGGDLTEKVRRKPYSVILFDEIEKAHPDIFNLFLQILDEGQLVDSLGNVVNFKNTIIIFTSNLGSDKWLNKSSLGFKTSQMDIIKKKEEIMNDIKLFFKPEFINRLDGIEIFNPLTKENLYLIFDLMIENISKNLKDKNITLKIDKKTKSYIIDKGYDEKYGARSLMRAISKYIEEPLAELLIKNYDKKSINTIKTYVNSENIDFKIS